MSIHFHPLRVKDIRVETPECVSVAFEIPDHLRQNFQFTQGQSLTVKTVLNGEEIRRTYSLCSSPLDNEWRVAIKKVPGGLFSGFAHDLLKKGDVLEVMSPVGKFYTELNPSHQKHYMAFAAGSGITPVLSLIKTTLATEPYSSFTLVYGNRNRHSIIFFEELEGLKNKYPERFHLVHILSRERTDAPVNSGRISVDKLMELDKLVHYNTMDEFFLCGPEEMIFCIKGFLEAKDIDKSKIHFELFTIPGERKLAVNSQQSITNNDLKSLIVIKADGRSFEFDLPVASHATILDAALKQGADLPFACKGGVCCTCKAKLLEGRVEMDVHWGLEEEEIAKGFILTCQSHPVSEKVVIDFDIK